MQGVVIFHGVVQAIECPAQDRCPVLDGHIRMQRWHAVGATVEQIQLVGEFVNNNIASRAGREAIPVDVLPREDHRPL